MSLIYLVEDSATMRAFIAGALTSHVVRGFEDVRGLIPALSAIEPDLLILDMALPGRDAFELLATAEVARTIPLLCISAERSNVAAAELMNRNNWRFPAFGALVKSGDPAAVRDAVDALLDNGD